MSYETFLRNNTTLAHHEGDARSAWEAIESWGLANNPDFMTTLNSWFQNFGAENIQLALKILKKIDYYSSDRLHKEIDSRLNMLARNGIFLSGEYCNAVVVTSNNPSDSSALFPYFISKLERANLEVLKVSDIEKLSVNYKDKFLVFFNDTHGTGNQFISKDIWPHLEGKFPCQKIIVVGIVIAEDAQKAFKKNGFVVIPDSPAATIFSSFNADELAKLTQLGNSIYPGHPLGYGRTGLLVAYEHQCPNNTIPVINQKRERHNHNFAWSPLFPYREKPKGIANSQQIPDAREPIHASIQTSSQSSVADGNNLSPPAVFGQELFANSIANIESPNAQDSDRFGQKISKLSLLRKNGVKVPDGFCLDHHFIKSVTDGNEQTRLSLIKEFERTLSKSKSGFLIVRSSASVEDNSRHLFPGIFPSIERVNTFEGLIEALTTCLNSLQTETVRDYAAALEVDISNISMAVLVQEQILPLLSGVAFTSSPMHEFSDKKGVYVEYCEGKAIQSKEVPVTFAYFLEAKTKWKSTLNPVSSNTSTGNQLEKRKIILKQLKPLIVLAKKIKKSLNGEQDIEWVLNKDHEMFIVQARAITQSIPHPKKFTVNTDDGNSSNDNPLLPRQDEIGLKGASMVFFSENKLFKHPTCFIEPNTPEKEITQRIRETNFGDKGITIRFSHGDEIGLPRNFVSSNEEALTWFLEKGNPQWLGILYGYMHVEHSFELYLEKNYFVLEHIPGVWESNNSNEPDVIIETNTKTTYLRTLKNRRALYIEPSGRKYNETEPVEFNMMVQWRENFRDARKILEKAFSAHLPLNAHFVADDASEWNFLNIRKIKQLKRISTHRRGTYHIVTNINDLRAWDNRKPILLQLVTERGTEKELIKLLPYLPTEPDKLYISFGLLSHPAIVLREYGLNPRPVYSSHERMLHLKQR